MIGFIPPPTSQVFHEGINHPDLYLWDTWSYVEFEVIHLYCLAISRIKPNGETLKESERNDFPFHVRHFSSRDDGETWLDQGCFQKPRQTQHGHDARNVWSGSIAVMPSGKKLVAYTGLYEITKERSFLQSLALAESEDGLYIDWLDQNPISCPIRDRKQILELGYYLDDDIKLGDNNGEDGGPIMSWRDPFIYCDEQDKIHLIFSAKSDPRTGVLAQCLLDKTVNGYIVDKMLPPVRLPDDELFTQAELPKVYHDTKRNIYYLMVSTCNRINEGQSDQEVAKTMRLYKSESINGPWECAVDGRSSIAGSTGLFGMTVLKTDFERNRALCISPRIGTNNLPTSLTLSAPFYLDFSSNSI